MAGLDTNILVRWLVDDDPPQVRLTGELFESARESRRSLRVPTTVTLELEWVLRSRYGFEKADILAAFGALLETQELDFQDEPAVERALHLYRETSVEFTDCMHASLCASDGHAPLLTFDRKAARLPSVMLVAR